MQRNWIGRSEGARVRVSARRVRRSRRRGDRGLHHAHRHDLRRDLRAARARASAGRAVRGGERRIRRRSARSVAAVPRAGSRRARMTGEVEKEGFDTGRTAINPFTEQAGADLGRELRAGRVRHRRGHGACPAHDERDFEFARKYSLPITRSCVADATATPPRRPTTMTEAHDRRRARSSTPASSTACRATTADRRDDRRRRGARHRRGRRCSTG